MKNLLCAHVNPNVAHGGGRVKENQVTDLHIRPAYLCTIFSLHLRRAWYLHAEQFAKSELDESGTIDALSVCTAEQVNHSLPGVVPCAKQRVYILRGSGGGRLFGRWLRGRATLDQQTNNYQCA